MRSEYSPNTCRQGHIHEIEGSVKIVGCGKAAHNHRFTSTTGEAIFIGASHMHEVKFKTDTFEGHEHSFCGKTSGAIMVGDRHVHFLECNTEQEECHMHAFRASTAMNDLIGC